MTNLVKNAILKTLGTYILVVEPDRKSLCEIDSFLFLSHSDTSCGMAYLESKKLVHRDLAARNVLIADDGTAKVCSPTFARVAF